MLTAALVAGCAGSGSDSTVDTVDSVVEEEVEIDLAEGAFERNDGSRTDPGDTAVTPDDATDSTGAAGNDSGSPTTVAAPGDAPIDGGGTATTTSGTASTTEAGGSTGTTDGQTAGTTTGGTTTAGTTGGGTTGSGTTGGSSPAVAQPGQGVIVVGGTDYVFPATVCEFDAESALVEGQGVSAAFGAFQASIFYVAGFGSAGGGDLSLDVVIDFAVPTGGETDELPELYASKIDSDDFSSGADIVVTVEGQRITGGGLMTDFNGVVFPVDEPGPMTFDARCS